MKYLLAVLTCTALFSCSNRNEVTTQLMNEKKLTENEIDTCKAKELLYEIRYKAEIQAGKDSTIWSALADSSGFYFRKGQSLKTKLKALEFSIDSISRMK